MLSMKWAWTGAFALLLALFGCGVSNSEFEEVRARATSLEEQIQQSRDRIAELELENQDLRRKLIHRPDVIEVTRESVRVEVEEVRQPIEFHILAEQTFASNDYRVHPKGEQRIREIAGTIRRKYPNRRIVVEGHTDNVPFKLPEGFSADQVKIASNWDLSALRAISVRACLEAAGIPRRLLSIAAFADQDPVASNATEEGRRRNRRVVIVVQPSEEEILRAWLTPRPETDSKER